MTITAATLRRIAAMPREVIGEMLLILADQEEELEARRTADAARTARYRSRGGGQISEELRAQVLARDEYRCIYCGSDDHLQIDHVVPVSKGGPTTLDNLATACRPCNAKKRDRDRKAFANSTEIPRNERGNSTATPPSPKKVPPKPPSKNTPDPPLPFSNENGVNQTLSMNVFEDFWSAFPKRLGSNPKKPAKARFEAALRDGADPQDLIAAAHRLAAQHPTPSVYVPHAATWLNQERWKDEARGPPAENIVRFRTVEEIEAEVEAQFEAEQRANGERAKSL